MEKTIHTQFIIDDKGKKSSVVLPVEEYNTIIANNLELEKINALLVRLVASLPDKGESQKEFKKVVSQIRKSSKSVESAFNLEYQKVLLHTIKTIDELSGILESKEEEPSKKGIFAGIKQGFKEAKLIQEGKLKAKSMKQLLDEL
ncbi:hypothetical protein [Leptospira sanjuanensis]|uniref:hypothetical protein n=1 Tax=Leptospira sanjuanensis TaxID=2879643 RepID=UPI001EE7A503|nr:hypothetical protein [Leptospira sanjuanensis]MCG6167190.1 hypothetical protein [Leptospira sanjuanensis]MCG6167202.1 hypothetical protein [Leptospira sanjuanensis]